MHFQHSGAKISVFEQTTDFGFFYSATSHEYFIYLFLLANSYEPLVVSSSVLNLLFVKTGVVSKEKEATSSREMKKMKWKPYLAGLYFY